MNDININNNEDSSIIFDFPDQSFRIAINYPNFPSGTLINIDRIDLLSLFLIAESLFRLPGARTTTRNFNAPLGSLARAILNPLRDTIKLHPSSFPMRPSSLLALQSQASS